MTKQTETQAADVSASPSALKVRIVKNVTLPLFKFEDGAPAYFRFESAMYAGKIIEQDKDKDGNPKKAPPTMARVTNLETGELGEIIMGTVLVKELEQAYSGDAYVGLCFQIEKHAPEGKRAYSLWKITEIEIEA